MAKFESRFCFTEQKSLWIALNFMRLWSSAHHSHRPPGVLRVASALPKILMGRKQNQEEPLVLSQPNPECCRGHRHQEAAEAGCEAGPPEGSSSGRLQNLSKKHDTFYNIIACFIDIHSKAVYNTIVRHIFGEIWYVVKNAVKLKFIKIISKCYSVGVKTQYIMISK